MRRSAAFIFAVLALLALASPALGATGVHKIRHVVWIMQENRSFDSYFGTFPGVDGIPGLAGNPGRKPCLPDPRGRCASPYHSRLDRNTGAPHSYDAFATDVNGGRMNGFVRAMRAAARGCRNPNNPRCASGRPDVMAYHDGREIPNYWAYARRFVLADHMFESVRSWSLPSHLFMVSEWAAICGRWRSSCVNDPQMPSTSGYLGRKSHGPWRWTDLTYLLHKHHVSWRYYVLRGTAPDCEQDKLISCKLRPQRVGTPSIWNPLPYFSDVHVDHQLHNIMGLQHFFWAARTGHLPAVSWIDPSGTVSEHPPGRVSAGQSYVTGLVNAIGQSPEWRSTAVFVTWDDWGGFYDHVDPPAVDQNGYGLRVSGLIISPYAHRGLVDHDALSFDSINRFIEDAFVGGRRIDPAGDGRADGRPDVREQMAGSLASAFNFGQRPRPPLLLPIHPKTDLR